MELLDQENILTGEEINRILGDIDADSPSEEPEEREENKTQEEEPVVEDLDDEFSSKPGPESVGSDHEPPAPGSGSPTPNLFNSIAAALREEGVFPDLDDETLSQVKDAGSFRQLIDAQINAGLSEDQRRIKEALQNGVQPDQVQQYENTLAYLNQITDEMVSARDNEGDNLRKRLIYQDLINRGYSQEKAVKEVKKSIDAGTDIEDAKEALEANRQYFQGGYNNLLNSAKQRRKQAEDDYRSRAKQFEESLLKDKKVFGSVDVDSNTRRRVLDVLTKPTKKDEEGRYYTELQWAQHENPDQFSRNIGLLYVLTNGFTDVEKLIAPQVKQRTAKGLAELERVINDTQRNPDGSLRLMSGVTTDPDSIFSGNVELDI